MTRTATWSGCKVEDTMDFNSISARSLPKATDEHPTSDPFTQPKVDADKLAAKLQGRPSAKIADKLLLVAAKLRKRQQARQALTAQVAPPPTAAEDASALDPVG